jgi:SPP1 gp7 family putative phage head morphogenesis protein
VLDLFDRGAPKTVLRYHETKEAAQDVADWIKRRLDEVAKESKARWADAVPRLIRSTGQASVAGAALDLGISFELLIPGLSKYVAREAAWLVTNVSDTTRQTIRDALDAGLTAGEGIPDLRKRIEESGAFAPSRAELIARTETTRVANGSQVESLKEYQKESGNRVRKEWLATKDSRTREAHRAMDGERTDIDGVFSNGLAAPSEPNCRCTLIYAIDD